MKLTIAITGMNARADNPGPGVAVMRCVREAYPDAHIVGLSYDALDPGLYLPLCNASYLIPYPSTGENALLRRIAQIQEYEHIDVLIPCLDAELLSFEHLQSELQKMGIAMFLPTAAQLQMRDKGRLQELAQLADALYPETRVLSNTGFFYNCHLEGWHYPMVVKGPFYEAQVVYTPEEATAAFSRIAAAWGLPILAQRLVVGEEFNLAAIGDGKGKMFGAVMMKKRATTDKGKAWAGISIDDEKLEAMAASLIKQLDWRGPLEVEVIRDQKGNYHLIEINPRFPAWIYLSAGLGRNLPAALVAMILGKPLPNFPKAKPGTWFVRHAQEAIVPIGVFESMMIDGYYAPEEAPSN